MNARLLRHASVVLLAFGLAPVRAQAPPTAATIDAEPIVLTAPERYQIVATLEPIRRVTILAPTDGAIRSLDVSVGADVRENQEIAELDRGEAAARLKIAEAELQEHQARTEEAPSAVGRAIVKGAEARVELARLELDRLTLRAPFAGRIVATPIASGQFVLKGTVIAELADLSILKALVPVDRRLARIGAETKIAIEDQTRVVQTRSLVPLPTTDEYRPLRELAAPMAAAWIQVPNPGGVFEAGSRVRSVHLPTAPVTVVPRAAVQGALGSADATVQVIRAEHVVDVRVKSLGEVGPERIQVSGPFRGSDAVVVSSTIPLVPGAFVRFGVSGRVEGVPPDPTRPGRSASVSPTSTPSPTAAPGSQPIRRPIAPPAQAPDVPPF